MGAQNSGNAITVSLKGIVALAVLVGSLMLSSQLAKRNLKSHTQLEKDSMQESENHNHRVLDASDIQTEKDASDNSHHFADAGMIRYNVKQAFNIIRNDLARLSSSKQFEMQATLEAAKSAPHDEGETGDEDNKKVIETGEDTGKPSVQPNEGGKSAKRFKDRMKYIQATEDDVGCPCPGGGSFQCDCCPQNRLAYKGKGCTWCAKTQRWQDVCEPAKTVGELSSDQAKVKAQKDLELNTAQKIQAQYPGNKARAKVEAQKGLQDNAAQTIQARYQGNKARAEVKAQKGLEDNAAQTIQARYRGNKARAEVKAQKSLEDNAAQKIQARYRGNEARDKIEAQKDLEHNAARKIQAQYRGNKARVEKRSLESTSESKPFQATSKPPQLTSKPPQPTSKPPQATSKPPQATSKPSQVERVPKSSLPKSGPLPEVKPEPSKPKSEQNGIKRKLPKSPKSKAKSDQPKRPNGLASLPINATFGITVKDIAGVHAKNGKKAYVTLFWAGKRIGTTNMTTIEKGKAAFDPKRFEVTAVGPQVTELPLQIDIFNEMRFQIQDVNPQKGQLDFTADNYARASSGGSWERKFGPNATADSDSPAQATLLLKVLKIENRDPGEWQHLAVSN